MKDLRSSAGFSLAEVVVALGILAGVVISVSGLFVLSTRQLRAGGRSSAALSVARQIIEEMDSWSFEQTHTLLSGCVPTATTCTFDTRTVTSVEAITRWQARLNSDLASPGSVTADSTTSDSWAEIVLDALPAARTLETADGLRILVRVHWSRGERRRSIELEALRL